MVSPALEIAAIAVPPAILAVGMIWTLCWYRKVKKLVVKTPEMSETNDAGALRVSIPETRSLPMFAVQGSPSIAGRSNRFDKDFLHGEQDFMPDQFTSTSNGYGSSRRDISVSVSRKGTRVLSKRHKSPASAVGSRPASLAPQRTQRNKRQFGTGDDCNYDLQLTPSSEGPSHESGHGCYADFQHLHRDGPAPSLRSPAVSIHSHATYLRRRSHSTSHYHSKSAPIPHRPPLLTRPEPERQGSGEPSSNESCVPTIQWGSSAESGVSQRALLSPPRAPSSRQYTSIPISTPRAEHPNALSAPNPLSPFFLPYVPAPPPPVPSIPRSFSAPQAASAFYPSSEATFGPSIPPVPPLPSSRPPSTALSTMFDAKRGSAAFSQNYPSESDHHHFSQPHHPVAVGSVVSDIPAVWRNSHASVLSHHVEPSFHSYQGYHRPDQHYHPSQYSHPPSRVSSEKTRRMSRSKSLPPLEEVNRVSGSLSESPTTNISVFSDHTFGRLDNLTSSPEIISSRALPRESEENDDIEEEIQCPKKGEGGERVYGIVRPTLAWMERMDSSGTLPQFQTEGGSNEELKLVNPDKESLRTSAASEVLSLRTQTSHGTLHTIPAVDHSSPVPPAFTGPH